MFLFLIFEDNLVADFALCRLPIASNSMSHSEGPLDHFFTIGALHGLIFIIFDLFWFILSLYCNFGLTFETFI